MRVPRWIFRLQHRLSMTHNEFVAVVVAVTLLTGGEVAKKVLPGQPAYDAEFYRARDSLFTALSQPDAPSDTVRAGADSSATPDSTALIRRPQTAEAGERGIDINHATAAELVRLPGIGPRLAQRIIVYREKHGPFQDVRELQRVSGIGPKKLDDLVPLVRVRL